jgi:hypothetical protein
MKKRFTSLLLALPVAMLFFATSCTRNYTCQCTMTYTGAPGLPDGETRSYTIKDTQGGAKSKCEASSQSYDKNGIHTVESCDLF